jgi:hypothetical protein
MVKIWHCLHKFHLSLQGCLPSSMRNNKVLKWLPNLLTFILSSTLLTIHMMRVYVFVIPTPLTYANCQHEKFDMMLNPTCIQKKLSQDLLTSFPWHAPFSNFRLFSISSSECFQGPLLVDNISIHKLYKWGVFSCILILKYMCHVGMSS